MKKILRLSCLALLLMTVVRCGTATADELSWGKNLGPVSAVVAGTDRPEGLTVRAEPSETSQVLSHIPVGESIEGRNIFKDGWMKIEKAESPGWIPIAYLQPLAFERMVTKTAGADFCLPPIVDAPTDAGKKGDCAQVGRVLKFSGIMPGDDWLQLADEKGWVRSIDGLRDRKFVSKDGSPGLEEAKVPKAALDPDRSKVGGSTKSNRQPSPGIQRTEAFASPEQRVEQKPIKAGQGSTDRMLEESWHDADMILLLRGWANY